MKKGFVLGLLVAALGFSGYTWFTNHYIIVTPEELKQFVLAMLEMYCPK